MAIRIWRLDKGYLASVSPPHASTTWDATAPMSAVELLEKLQQLGCQQDDIGDAFFKADPSWLERTFA